MSLAGPDPALAEARRLRLHMVPTLHGLPIAVALTGAKADERQVLLGTLHADPALTDRWPGQLLIADKNYSGAEFQAALSDAQVSLLRPARKGEPDRPGGESSSRYADS